MAWYVFAVVDAPPPKPGRGLSGPLAVRRIDGGFAVVERRADVPPFDFGTLQAHERIVERLAALVPAILPVRFGTLLSSSDLETSFVERREELREAFDRVRGRVQFTWRSAGAEPVTRARAQAARTRSGTDYLRRAARAAHPPAPSSFRRVRRLANLAAEERFAEATTIVPAALYHLVDRVRAGAYASAAADVRTHAPGLTWSGPFAPYAFAPELL
jgi:Gas vesicle synthesis protein GvpL/GvpF